MYISEYLHDGNGHDGILCLAAKHIYIDSIAFA